MVSKETLLDYAATAFMFIVIFFAAIGLFICILASERCESVDKMQRCYERNGYTVIGSKLESKNFSTYTIKMRLSWNGKEYDCVREVRNNQLSTDRITPVQPTKQKE